MDRFQIIQSLKQEKSLFINDINYGRIVSTILYKTNVKYKILIIVKQLISVFNLEKVSKKSDILFTYSFKSYNRSDYNYIADKFCEISNSDTMLINSYYSLNIVIKRLFRSIHFFKNVSNISYISKLDKMIIATAIVQYEEIVVKLSNEVKGYKLVTTFCDAHPIGNLIAQLARNNKITTSTLQHGQYKMISEGKENADVEAYSNFISDYLFAWGEVTIKEFEKSGVNKERLLNAGALKPFSYNKPLNINLGSEDKSIFGIILDSDVYQESNINMIKIANRIADELKMKYIIRVHPRNKIKKYKAYIKNTNLVEIISGIENEEYIKRVDFSIIHMAGVYIELLSLAAPFFVLQDEFTEEIFTDNFSNFTNYNEFKDVYFKYSLSKMEYIEKIKNRYSKFNSNDIEKNYQRFIKMLIV